MVENLRIPDKSRFCAMHVDGELIYWLLYESGISRYRIASAIRVADSTVSRIARGETPIETVSLENASRLTAYAKKVQSDSAAVKTASPNSDAGGYSL